MRTLLKTQTHGVQEGSQSFFYSYAMLSRSPQKPVALTSVKKYRDTIVWKLLCAEERVEIDNLLEYWELIDAMMDISLASAMTLLQNLYEYRIRKLDPLEKRRLYPGISNGLYRLEYDDDGGGHRDVCAATILHEALDLLQTEAERLFQS